jgi:hypothetical protein
MSEEVRRYDKYFQDGPGLLEQEDGMFVLYSDYQKLLAKYNYLLEWSHKQGDLGYSDFDFYRRTFERAYKGTLK